MTTNIEQRQIQLAIVIAVIVNDKGEVLLVKRKDKNVPAADGFWEFPGGHVEFDEDTIEAVQREAKEETGFDVKVIRLLPKIYKNLWDMASGEKCHTILISYECKIIGGQMHLKDFDKKISELKFAKPGNITQYNLLPQTKEIMNLLNDK